MTYANKATTGDLDIGKLLKIYSTKGIYNNLSTASELWKFMEKKRVAKPEGREVRYALKSARGQDAFQFLPAGSEGSFPAARRSTPVEAIAYFKDFGTTIDIPRHLLNKSGSDLAAYAQPLAEELDDKGVATARGLSRAVCGDGTGVLGVISSAAIVSGDIVVTLSSSSANAGKSHVGWFEPDEKVLIYSTAGAFQTNTNDPVVTTTYYRVVSTDSSANTVTLQPYSATDVALNASAVNDVTSGDLIYPAGVGTDHINNLSGAVTDYGLVSNTLVGLESLAADDGRTVNGVALSGVLAGSRVDANGSVIDRTHFQSVLSMAKRRAGKDRYKFTTALMFDDTYDAMMESWETDRMIVSSNDTDRGSKGSLGYMHGKDKVSFTPDEFVQKNRIFIPAEGDALQFRGTSIDQVEVDGKKLFMPVDSNGNHKRIVRAYLEGSGMLLCQHAAAIGVIENFIV